MGKSTMMNAVPRKALPQRDVRAFGDRLRRFRKAKGWTQTTLAQNAGIERSMVGNYELGLSYPPIPTLIKLAETLQLSVDRLLDIDGDRTHEIQDRGLYQLFVQVDQADYATQGLIKQVVDGLLIARETNKSRTGTEG